MVSKRVKQTQAPPLVELGALAARTDNCISLGQGVPYYQLDDDFLSSFASNIGESKFHRYTPDPGIPELRAEVAQKFVDDNHVKVDPSEVIITNGANQAFVNVIFSICDPGDRVALITPYYFNHYMACSLGGIIVDQVNMTDDFHLNPKSLDDAIKKKPKVVVLVNPGNPTGHVLTSDDIGLLSDSLESRDIFLVSDETYEYFTYNNTKHIPAASDNILKEQTITIGSFSKTFGIPGWRLGYYTGPKDLLDESVKIQDTTTICAPAPAQQLGLRLLHNRDMLIPKFVSVMEQNHKIAKDLIEEVKWLETSNSKGAYYLFPKQTSGIESEKLAKDLIIKNKVAIIPGKAFGEKYEDYFRISFANVNTEQLTEAFERLKKVNF